MKRCVVCGEQYGEEYRYCPVCGCPEGKYTIAGLGFPEKLEQQYVLAGLRQGSGGRQYLSLMSRKTGRTILAGKLSAGESRLQQLVSRQMEEKLPELPAVYETAMDLGEMVFLFEEVPGVTLRELAERDYPLDVETVRHAMDFTARQLEILAQRGVELGQTDLNSCGITESGIRLRDFGGEQRNPEEEARFSGWTVESGQERGKVSLGSLLGQNRVLLIVVGALALIVIIQLVFLFGYWR